MFEVRDATRDDLAAAGRTLASAFADDPVLRHFVPEKHAWKTPAARWFAAEAGSRMAPDLGRSLVTDGVEGVAVWAAPDRWRPSMRDLARGMPSTVSLFGARLVVVLRMLALMERHHPRQPHWYLQFLGTDPHHQGRGAGTALLAPVLRHCDEAGVPAYLESSKESNISFYARHGFDVREPLTVPAGGPQIWPMWREPRPPIDDGDGDGFGGSR